MRYRAVLAQWQEVEVYFAEHYRLEPRDIVRMSWRRFRTLLSGGFKITPAAAPETDWQAQLDAISGREPADRRTVITLDDYLRQRGGDS